jgi:hypothetical protein
MLTNLCDKLKLRALKDFVMKKLPPTSTVRQLILTEPDEIPREEYVVKFRIWASLLNKELSQQSSGSARC